MCIIQTGASCFFLFFSFVFLRTCFQEFMGAGLWLLNNHSPTSRLCHALLIEQLEISSERWHSGHFVGGSGDSMDRFGMLVLVTCVLQLGSALLHLILRASVSDGDDHLGHVSPHPIVKREGLVIGVLQRHSCSTEETRVRKTSLSLFVTVACGVRSNLSWCFLPGSGCDEVQTWRCLCLGKRSVWTLSLRRRCTARMTPVGKVTTLTLAGNQVRCSYVHTEAQTGVISQCTTKD